MTQGKTSGAVSREFQFELRSSKLRDLGRFPGKVKEEEAGVFCKAQACPGVSNHAWGGCRVKWYKR